MLTLPPFGLIRSGGSNPQNLGMHPELRWTRWSLLIPISPIKLPVGHTKLGVLILSLEAPQLQTRTAIADTLTYRKHVLYVLCAFYFRERYFVRRLNLGATENARNENSAPSKIWEKCDFGLGEH